MKEYIQSSMEKVALEKVALEKVALEKATLEKVTLARITLAFLVVAFLAGCASSEMKSRKSERERVIQAGKMYCDFINGDIYKDIEVAVNIQMAKNCDSSKPFSLTNYKLASENNGILFCCAPVEKEKKESATSLSTPSSSSPSSNNTPKDKEPAKE